jgi:DnaT DNA-binding domain
MHNETRATLMPLNWRPDETAFQLLAQHNIPYEFIEDEVPEFEMYWRERRQAQFSWNSKFVKHVIHSWRRRQSEDAKSVREIRMTEQWRPNDLAIQQLRAEGMTDTIIAAALVDFILYWMERGDICATWSSKFVQFTRTNAARFQTQQPTKTRDLTLQEQLTDRDWAK